MNTSTKAKAFTTFKRIIYALVLREISLKVKNTHISWVILEPLLHVLFYLALWSAITRSDKNGVDILAYLSTGIIPWFLCRNIISRSFSYLDKSLLEFYYIKPLDILLAGILVDIVTYAIIYFITIGILVYTGKDIVFSNAIMLISCYMSLIVFATGISLILIVAMVFFPIIKRIAQYVLRVMYFTSCVIIPASIIPYEYFQFLYFNPVVHMMELSRKCIFISFITPIESPYYMYSSSIIILFLALLCYTRYQNVIARTD